MEISHITNNAMSECVLLSFDPKLWQNSLRNITKFWAILGDKTASHLLKPSILFNDCGSRSSSVFVRLTMPDSCYLKHMREFIFWMKWNKNQQGVVAKENTLK